MNKGSLKNNYLTCGIKTVVSQQMMKWSAELIRYLQILIFQWDRVYDLYKIMQNNILRTSILAKMLLVRHLGIPKSDGNRLQLGSI